MEEESSYFDQIYRLPLDKFSDLFSTPDHVVFFENYFTTLENEVYTVIRDVNLKITFSLF
jgi:hypothetical protein